MTIRLNFLVKPVRQMSKIKKDNTEERILDAAQSVFIQKGMDGTRMQEIADTAGINKALLHYYFRTKQKLFEAIFKKIFSGAFPSIKDFLLSDTPIEEKLEVFIERYIDLLLKNPFLPIFILKEINRDPDFMIMTLKSGGVNPSEILDIFEEEMHKGNLRKMEVREILINTIGLCIFPFAAKPLLLNMFFENDKNAYKQFLVNRKTTVKDFVLNSILIK